MKKQPNHDDPYKDLPAYIEKFTKNAQEQLEKGNIALIMIYDNSSTISHRQFLHFKNYIRVTFGTETRGKKKRARQLLDQILPIDLRSELGKMLIHESRDWSRKINDPEAKIDHDPTFLDFKTHEIRLVGFHDEKDLRKTLKAMNDFAKKNPSSFKKDERSLFFLTRPNSINQ
jgi:hypothetical protein